MKFTSIFDIRKAYTEGIYAETPTNRKLGRVGMSYAEYAAKTKSGYYKKIEEETDEYYKEAKGFAKVNLNEGKFINFWGMIIRIKLIL